MLFHEFGSIDRLPVLLMHGMLQDWHTEYEMLRPLEEHYRLIIPAMDGMYDESPDFTSFADQCRQIEEYVLEHHGGRLHGVYGASQGALLLCELLARNRIVIDTAVMDGVYVAHQGRLAAWFGILVFRSVKRNGGQFPKAMDIVMKLMGLGKEDYAMFRAMYWRVSDVSLKRNLLENYTYHAKPELAGSNTMVHLWCGSKEPYALKSHRILKRYLRHYEEEIFPDMGHGQMLMRHPDEMCRRIRRAIG